MRAARIDANQPEIVAALRQLGATVQPLQAVSNGCPDLLVGWRGANILIEIKDGSKPPSARALTPDQEVWHQDWRGQVYVVTTTLQAVDLLLQVGQGTACK